MKSEVVVTILASEGLAQVAVASLIFFSNRIILGGQIVKGQILA